MEGKWIFLEPKRTEEPMLVCFKKKVQLETVPENCVINITADARYQLYINEKRVNTGPAKMPGGIRCYDEIDIGPFLERGTNRVFVKVLTYAKDPLKALSFNVGPISVVTEGVGGLLIHEVDTALGFSTDESYLCAKVEGYGFVKNVFAGYVGFSEHIDIRQVEASLEKMQNAQVVMNKENSNPYGLSSFWQLSKRPIPFMYEKESRDLTLKRQYENTYEYATSQYVFAFPVLKIKGTDGGVVKITYAESYGKEVEGAYIKGVRDNPEDQVVIGEMDVYITKKGMQEYIPFYPRAFRIIKIEHSEGVTIEDVYFIETGYPLEVEASFNAGDTYNKIWDVSLRTLMLCMYETYVDCPYYEQMQYLMDTYLESVYTLSVSKDARLVKKAINDFAYSSLLNGLLPCNAPSSFVQVIPGFAIYWILLLDTYFMYEDDERFVKQHLGTVDKILQFFISHINEEGLLGETGYWPFFDWVKGWERGVPVYGDVNILYNMLLVLGLRTAARLNREVGRESIFVEYESFADTLSEKIIEIAYDEETGLFKDAPSQEPTSTHAQVFAVVASVIKDEDDKKALMKRTVDNSNTLLPMSYAMRFFLCRALEETDMYDEVYKSFKLWDAYKDLIDLNMTTWPEDFVTQRSDCHGWSALPLSEFTRCYLGVRPIAYGFKKVGIYIYDSPFEKYGGVAIAKENKIFVDIDNVTGNVSIKVPKGLDFEFKDFRQNSKSPNYLISEY